MSWLHGMDNCCERRRNPAEGWELDYDIGHGPLHQMFERHAQAAMMLFIKGEGVADPGDFIPHGRGCGDLDIFESDMACDIKDAPDCRTKSARQAKTKNIEHGGAENRAVKNIRMALQVKKANMPAHG